MLKRLFAVAVLVGAVTIPQHLFAQEAGSSDVQNRRAQLEQQLAQLENQIADQQKLLDAKSQERVSLERDVAILDAKIDSAKLAIKARDLSIEELQEDIASKVATIGGLNDKLSREKESLAQLVRQQSQIDDYSLAELLLGSGTLSDIFTDVDRFDSIKGALHSSFSDIADTKNLTEAQKATLEDKKAQQLELRQIQVLEQQKIVEQEKERKQILSVTKGQEAAYQALLASTQKSAAQIRSELFTLRDSAAIPFGKALDLANLAYQKTGVRPAFLLGVLAEETNLGGNIGTGSWTVDMNPTRDKPLFLAITSQLGLDPNQMPVSKRAWYGWGGAMGPAQFIPSTWACFGGFYNTVTGVCGPNPNKTWVGPWAYDAGRDRIRKLTGGSGASNPWDNEDAFMAAAALLSDNGASAGTLKAERLAALRYLAGWANATKSAYAFYGNEVMELAANFQSQIDVLAKN